MTLLVNCQDIPDGDNIAEIILMRLWAMKRPDVELVTILEPRAVDFGVEILKPGDQNRLDSLLKKHFCDAGSPLQIRLKGLLTQENVEEVKDISEEDRNLLRKAIKYSHYCVEDSKRHASLMAWDLARCLGEMTTPGDNANFTILVDNDGLPGGGPVNLRCHAPEQLFCRTTEEIREFNSFMDLKMPRRRKRVEEWYAKCTRDAEEKVRHLGFSIDDLDLDVLREKIKAAKDVTFIGGASFKLLRRLIDDPEVAGKMSCLIQAGTLNLAGNIFNDQFNIALDPESADYVLRRHDAFLSFTAVPTHTSQVITFSVGRLEEYGLFGLARWILSFNLRNDPAKVSDGTVTLKGQYRDGSAMLPDLTMLLFAIKHEMCPMQKAKVVLTKTQSGSLLFKISDIGMDILEPKTGHTYEPLDLVDLFDSVQ